MLMQKRINLEREMYQFDLNLPMFEQYKSIEFLKKIIRELYKGMKSNPEDTFKIGICLVMMMGSIYLLSAICSSFPDEKKPDYFMKKVKASVEDTLQGHLCIQELVHDPSNIIKTYTSEIFDSLSPMSTKYNLALQNIEKIEKEILFIINNLKDNLASREQIAKIIILANAASDGVSGKDFAKSIFISLLKVINKLNFSDKTKLIAEIDELLVDIQEEYISPHKIRSLYYEENSEIVNKYVEAIKKEELSFEQVIKAVHKETNDTDIEIKIILSIANSFDLDFAGREARLRKITNRLHLIKNPCLKTSLYIRFYYFAEALEIINQIKSPFYKAGWGISLISQMMMDHDRREEAIDLLKNYIIPLIEQIKNPANQFLMYAYAYDMSKRLLMKNKDINNLIKAAEPLVKNEQISFLECIMRDVHISYKNGYSYSFSEELELIYYKNIPMKLMNFFYRVTKGKYYYRSSREFLIL